MVRLKSIYRHTWAMNQHLWHRVLPAFLSLEAAGIHAVLLGRTATVIMDQADGRYPLRRVDLLVKREAVPSAISTLEAVGWAPVPPLHSQSLPAHLGVATSHLFHDRTDGWLRLNWSPFWPGVPDQDVWIGVSGRRMDRVHQLLYACAPTWESTRLLIAASMLELLTDDTQIPWDRLIAQAQEYHLVAALGHALDAVRHVDQTLVPCLVRERLQATPTVGQEHDIYYLLSQPPTAWRRLRLQWLLHTNLGRSAGLFFRLRGFPRYLQHRWCLAGLHDLPGYITRELLR
jgi:hypothetical protein